MAENVKVAVRVRPFNSREKTRNAALIIQMNGKTTEIKDPSVPSQEPKKFTFDFSYWSHDGFVERSDGYLEPTSPNYADQSKVFEDLGQGVIANAWEGYNCSLFAYGQTGSGKSYSMVGYGANKGIIPIFCEDLFNGIEDKKKTEQTTEFQVTLSMLEIYNEQVWDLLNPGSKKKGGLKIRQHPSKGFYVESLVTVPVKSYEDIDLKIQEGTKSRTVAATNMNATSSRAHTIVAINFVQKTKKENTQGMTKSSIVNLVDLAGSERADSTGATGDRLKEGSAINQSLSTLGNCIKALADQSTGKKNIMVPFRDSVLTRLLKNALGGNSKTIMIAALSPADINFEETLSTLRFADRAKAIKTKAVINESPTEKLIRELREENQRLMEQLKAGGVIYVEAPQGAQATGVSDEEVEEMKKEMEEQLKRNQNEMEQMKKSWEERLMETENIYKAKEDKEKKQKEMRKTTAHFWNLNEDPQLSNMIHHFVTAGKHRIGNRKASPPADITLSGLSILSEHAIVSHEGNTITLTIMEDAKVLVNGKALKEQSVLHHNDRVMFGSSNLFVLHHPAELQEAQKKGVRLEEVTYDVAQEEIAENSGFDMGKTGGKSRDDLLLQEDLMKIVPMINEANAMSEELNKKVKFEVALVSPQARGLKEGRTEVLVKMKSKEDDAEWVWDKNKFMNRKFIMQEMYQNYVEGEEWDVEKERDPFWEPDDAEVMIGTVHVYLQSLGYKIEMEESLAITDHKGNELGHLQFEAFPCDDKGNEDIEDFVEDPQELIGNSLYFNLRIPHARGLPQRFGKGETYVKYKFYLDKEPTITNTISGTINPNFNHEKFFSFVPVTQQLVKYLTNKAFVIEVWGRQTGRKVGRVSPAPTITAANKTTKETPDFGTELGGSKSSTEKNLTLANGELASGSSQNMKLELNKAIRRGNRMEKKLKLLRDVLQDAKGRNQEVISVDVLDSILYSGKGDKFKAVSNILLQTRKHANRPRAKTNTSSACVIA